jgi:hypothetical protein
VAGTLVVRRPDHPAAYSHRDQRRQVGQRGVTDIHTLTH